MVRDDEIAIMTRRRVVGKRPGSSWSFVWNDESDLTPYLDASWLLAEVSHAVLAAHVHAIAAGDMARGGPQAPLDPFGQSGRAARAGRRPDARGVARTDGRSLPDLLTRDPIKGRGGAVSRSKKSGTARVGTLATTSIRPGSGGHTQFLSKDAQRGVEYFFVDGDIEKVIDRAVGEWLNAAFEGPPSDLGRLEFGQLRGSDVR